MAISAKPSTSLIIPSHIILPIAETFEKEEDKKVSKDAIVNSHTSDISFYPEDLSVSEDKFVLQNSLLNDDHTVYILDDGETQGPNFPLIIRLRKLEYSMLKQVVLVRIRPLEVVVLKMSQNKEFQNLLLFMKADNRG
nr:hypothetical protein [Bartonella vinsonii]